jgi:hypothetical protein
MKEIKFADIKSQQKRDILDHLLAGKPLTKIGALTNYGIWNSGDVIHKLRKEYGYDFIVTQMVRQNGKEHAVYKINFKYIQTKKLVFC